MTRIRWKSRTLHSIHVAIIWLIWVLIECNIVSAVRDTFCPTWVGSPDTLAFTSDDGSMCYIFDDRHVTWHQANSICSDAGWRLLKIPSQHVQLFFEREYENIRRKIGTTYPCFWIGLSDHQREDVFLWTDGSPMGYNLIERHNIITKWKFDCVAFCRKIMGSGGFEWPVKYCSGVDTFWGFVCEAVSLKITTTTASATRSALFPRTDRSKRTKRHQGFQRMRNFTDVILETKPEFSSRCHIVTACARECTRTLSPCVVFNFRASNGMCHGYSSFGVLAADTKPVGGWQLYTKL